MKRSIFAAILLCASLAWASKIQLMQDDIGGGLTVGSGQIVVGNASGNPAVVTVSGDVAISNAGVVSISAGVITAADIADVELAALGGLTSAANKIPYFTGSGTAGVISSSANVVTFLAAANNAAMADIIAAAISEGDLADSTILTADIKDGEITAADIGDAELAAIGGLTSAANAIPYFTGSGTAGVISSSANVVTFLAAADNAAMADIIAAACTEGDLADSTIVSADIKDAEIVNADINAAAAIANTKLGYPAIRTNTQALTVSEFTDNAGTATGYVDLSVQIPAQSMVLGWKCDVSSGFAGDTTAVMEIGVAGTTAAFTADATQSVFGVATVGSNSLAASSYTTAATTVRVTVTGGADFTTIKTADTAACTVTVYYVQTE